MKTCFIILGILWVLGFILKQSGLADYYHKQKSKEVKNGKSE